MSREKRDLNEVKNEKRNHIDELFVEVQDELNEDMIKDAKIKIKDLLLQKAKTEKILGNISRQIDELKLQIKQDLFQ